MFSAWYSDRWHRAPTLQARLVVAAILVPGQCGMSASGAIFPYYRLDVHPSKQASGHKKSKYVPPLCTTLFVTAVLGASSLAIRSVPLLAAYFVASDKIVAGYTSPVSRNLYAVNQSPKKRGTISVYDIGARHRLIKTINTVPDVGDVRGVAASTVTGKLYVAYRNSSGIGMIYCLNVYNEEVLWNRAVNPRADRLSINPDGQLLYVPTWEGGSADYINVLDARTGDVVRKVYFSNRSHDTQYPLSGPIFQETKAQDGSGHYLYRIDPKSYAVSRTGPYAGILGPYAVDSQSRHVVNDVTHLWGMQVADLKTGEIVTATLPGVPPGDLWLMHGIGWTPDETEVWQSSAPSDSHVYVWDMTKPMDPVLKQ